MLSIEGWAVARHGVAAIEAFLDGALVGAASRGVRRLDIGAAYPEWPEALMSGYAILLPRKVFTKDKHVLRIAVRDKRGETSRSLNSASRSSRSTSTTRARNCARFVPQAEIDLKSALIAAAPYARVRGVHRAQRRGAAPEDLAANAGVARDAELSPISASGSRAGRRADRARGARRGPDWRSLSIDADADVDRRRIATRAARRIFCACAPATGSAPTR